MNIPNMISLFRILLVPVFIFFFKKYGASGNLIYPIGIFIISGISDLLDGYVARKYNLKTDLGAALDPLADKLMLITALICFALYNYIPYWLVVIIALKELIMIFGGFLAYKEGIVTPANVYGKIATLIFHLAIFFFLFSNSLAFILLIVSLCISLYAFYNYIKITLSKKKKKDSKKIS